MLVIIELLGNTMLEERQTSCHERPAAMIGKRLRIEALDIEHRFFAFAYASNDITQSYTSELLA